MVGYWWGWDLNPGSQVPVSPAEPELGGVQTLCSKCKCESFFLYITHGTVPGGLPTWSWEARMFTCIWLPQGEAFFAKRLQDLPRSIAGWDQTGNTVSFGVPLTGPLGWANSEQALHLYLFILLLKCFRLQGGKWSSVYWTCSWGPQHLCNTNHQGR